MNKMKNLLFSARAVKAQEERQQLMENSAPPMCPRTHKPMIKVICGSHNGKKFFAWASPDVNTVLPVFRVS
jgi:hypothetical protein